MTSFEIVLGHTSNDIEAFCKYNSRRQHFLLSYETPLRIKSFLKQILQSLILSCTLSQTTTDHTHPIES